MSRGLLATQGGGYAVWDDLQADYVWHQIPAWLKPVEPNTRPGDPIPPEWGIASTNLTENDIPRG